MWSRPALRARPLLALLLAREGVPVLIQGRHDFESRVSPFELLAALDIAPAASIAEAEAQLALDALDALPPSVFKDSLIQLSEFAVARKY